MAPSRKSRGSRRTKRKSRGVSRRSKRQRGGATIVLNCTLDANNNVQVANPPAELTLDSSVPKALTITPTKTAVTDITFAGPGGPVNPRSLGVGAGIMIEQGAAALVPKGFTAIRKLVGTQRKLNSTAPVPVNTAIKIRNLETAPLGLGAANRNFTITVTTV
jgi:hypothetical protein